MNAQSMRLGRPYAFVACIAVAFLGGALIPGVGVDYTYLFIIVLVLGAWFSIKWSDVKTQKIRGSSWEILLGVAIVFALYGYKIVSGAKLGILDFTILFSALAITFYGVRSFKLFWVPAVYGVVLLLGYQLENLTPNYVAMQDWMASVMGSAMSAIGVSTIVSGHFVYLNSGANTLALNVEGDCTGVQGILAFGLLSTMSVLDVKPKISRLVPIFAIGFLGAFLINIVRLFFVFITFEYLGVGAGDTVHVYLGYTLFIVWVLVFWSLAFRYLSPPPNKASEVFSAKPLGMPDRSPAKN
jgi:exosortase/archaeosortase family protein